MSRSNEGQASGNNSNIDEIDEKLQTVSVDDRDGDEDDDDDDINDGDADGNHDDDDVVVVDGDSASEHEQSSTLSHANYFDEPSLHLNNLNHLFHIDFMRSMQNLRTHEKRLANRKISTLHAQAVPIISLFTCLQIGFVCLFVCFSRFKNGTRRSATFTNEKMRQIERENQILLKKILAQRPRSSLQQQQQQSTSTIRNTSRVASAAINRRCQQERIDFANNILRKKIEKIAHRNPK